MDGFLAVKNGKSEKFTVEVLAIPGDGGNPTFTVRLTYPGGEYYTRSMTHDKTSTIFENIKIDIKKVINREFDNLKR